VPNEKLHTRLVCRKCHVVFHVEPSGRTVLGEPLSSREQRKEAKEKEKKAESHSMFEGFELPSFSDLTNFKDNLADGSIPVKPTLGVLGGIVALWFIWGFFNGPPESVADRARWAVQYLANDDLGHLKSYAAGSTADDLVRWYDLVHPQLESQRKTWSSKEANVQVVVVEENPSANRGEVEAFIMPAAPSMQAASVMPPAGSKSTAAIVKDPGPLAFHMKWTYSGGHWWIDGAQTLAIAPQAAR